MLQKFHPAVKKYINPIFEKPIPNILLYTEKPKGNLKRTSKTLYLEIISNSNKNALVKRKLKS